MFVISRPIEGISLNGNEYLLDDDGEILKFETREEAFDFLLPFYESKEILQEDLDNVAVNIDDEKEVL